MAPCQRRRATVMGTAATRNHDALRAVGATPFDYKDAGRMDAVRAAGGADVVFDPLGFDSFDRSFAVLAGVPAPRSAFPESLRLLSENLPPWRGRRPKFSWISRTSKTFAPDLLPLFDLARTGAITVAITVAIKAV